VLTDVGDDDRIAKVASYSASIMYWGLISESVESV